MIIQCRTSTKYAKLTDSNTYTEHTYQHRANVISSIKYEKLTESNISNILTGEICNRF